MSPSNLQIKYLLVATAAIEVATGIGLLAAPSLVVALLLGATIDAPVAVTTARVGGAAILTLGIACWLERSDEQSRASRRLVGAMLFYNVVVAMVFAYGGIALGLSAIGLWPAVVLHVGMAGWCLKSLSS